ncbi:hypothetical protein ACP70R_009120 [Stipagrostis hirtigluma subsp. patula]
MRREVRSSKPYLPTTSSSFPPPPPPPQHLRRSLARSKSRGL